MVFKDDFYKNSILLLWGCIQLCGPAFAYYVQGPQTDPQQHRERKKYKNKISRFGYITTCPKSSVLTFNFSLCPLKLILNFQYRLLKLQRSPSKPRIQKQVLCQFTFIFTTKENQSIFHVLSLCKDLSSQEKTSIPNQLTKLNF